MATEYTTTVRIDPATDTYGSTIALLGLYAALWLTLTLGGVYAAVLLADLTGGIVGAALTVILGLSFVAASPVVARRTMGRVLDALE